MENRERIVILGAGESGTGAAILARQKGFDVFVSDAGKIKPYYVNCWMSTRFYTSPGDIPNVLVISAIGSN